MGNAEMTTPLANSGPRFQYSNIIAACIVGVSLIVAAAIVAQRPVALAPLISPTGAASQQVVDGRPKVAPPIAQDSVARQFHDQVMSAPEVHTVQYANQTYTLSDIKVEQVTYSAKTDQFGLVYKWVWPADAPTELPDEATADFTNDGYGHYYGSAFLITNNAHQHASVTLRGA